MRPIILFLFFTFSAHSQLKGTVVDEKGNPVPFVNIWVENEDIGTTSDENGSFTIKATPEKQIIFSSVGFEVKKAQLSNNQKVVLKEAIYKLDEVLVSKRKQDLELEIGDAQKIHHKLLSGDKPWIYGKLFEYDPAYDKTPYLKKIVFYSDSEKKNASLKIRIFQFNDSIPTTDLLTDDLIVTVKKGMRKNEIDVSGYNLRFPENGIVIGLEWLIIEENRFIYEYKGYKSGIVTSSECYAPSLVVNYSQRENGFRYSGGKWVRSKLFVTASNDKPWDNKVMIPAINLILTN